LHTRAFSPQNGRIKTLNIVGRRIQGFRNAKHWSRSDLAIKLQIAGLDKSRFGVGRIESQIVYVRDYELLYFAKVLGVGLHDLYPEINGEKIHDVVSELMKPRKSNASPRPRHKKNKSRRSSRR
jgi:transcriptional regulator with XRE-family HTH domain